ncbi:MAG: hypothetical protein AB1758_35355, partial [Candidatus Eremiobacterota bacterium]
FQSQHQRLELLAEKLQGYAQEKPGGGQLPDGTVISVEKADGLLVVTARTPQGAVQVLTESLRPPTTKVSQHDSGGHLAMEKTGRGVVVTEGNSIRRFYPASGVFEAVAEGPRQTTGMLQVLFPSFHQFDDVNEHQEGPRRTTLRVEGADIELRQTWTDYTLRQERAETANYRVQSPDESGKECPRGDVHEDHALEIRFEDNEVSIGRDSVNTCILRAPDPAPWWWPFGSATTQVRTRGGGDIADLDGRGFFERGGKTDGGR